MWLNFDETEKMTLAEVGKYVYEKQACVTCHSTDGSVKTGPSFKGICGKNESLTSGTTQLVDENYVRESVLNPQAKIVAGFGKQMPSYQGQLNQRHIDGFIEFLKSVK